MRRARKGTRNTTKKTDVTRQETINQVPFDKDIKIYKKGENSQVPDANSAPVTKSPVVKKSRKNNKKFIVIFGVSLVVIIFASVLGMFLGGMFGGGNFAGISGGQTSNFIKPIDKATGRVNVLILGVDKEGLRTDTIIVASYDIDEGKVNVLSIPRDTRMYIGTKYQKINSAHAITKNGKIKGPQGTIEAVTRLTGIPINYYVEFNFEAFRKTIDTLDGVYFNVPQTMKYTDKTQDLYINLAPGYQKLDGDKAEQLVRFRQYPEGDIKRVRVQQEFMMALAEQKLTPEYISKAPELFGSVICKYVTTNLKLNDVARYSAALNELDLANIQMHELPGEYSGSNWKPDLYKIKELSQTYFECDASRITAGKPGTVFENLTAGADSTTTQENTGSLSSDTSSKDKNTDKDNKDKDKDKNNNSNDDEVDDDDIKTSSSSSKRPASTQSSSKSSQTTSETKKETGKDSTANKTPSVTTDKTESQPKESESTPTQSDSVSLTKPSGRPSTVIETE